jgi:hypothetical protein
MRQKVRSKYLISLLYSTFAAKLKQASHPAQAATEQAGPTVESAAD